MTPSEALTLVFQILVAALAASLFLALASRW